MAIRCGLQGSSNTHKERMIRLGLLSPAPIDNQKAALYDADWLGRRIVLAIAVGDERRHSEDLYALATEFVDATSRLYTNCWARRDQLPPLELAWRFVEPPLGGTRAYEDVYYRSPSLVLELCGALLLLLAVQMKRQESVSAQMATLERLRTTVSLNHVVPPAEMRCMHPALLSPHFYKECIEPLVVSYALLGDMPPRTASAMDCCLAAAAFACGANSLTTLANNAPPLMYNKQDRTNLLVTINVKETLVLVCAARALLSQGRAMRSDGSEAVRKEKFVLAQTLLTAALLLQPTSNEATAVLTELRSFTSAICLDLGPPERLDGRISFQCCDADDDRELNRLEVVKLFESGPRCALDWDGSVLRLAFDDVNPNE